MNGTEQRKHLTVVSEMTRETAEAFGVCGKRMNDLERKIGAERTRRLKLAEEQRGYVDGEDRQLRQRIDALYNRAFWSRLNWLFTGR